jgi:hypothetical protein
LSHISHYHYSKAFAGPWKIQLLWQWIHSMMLVALISGSFFYHSFILLCPFVYSYLIFIAQFWRWYVPGRNKFTFAFCILVHILLRFYPGSWRCLGIRPMCQISILWYLLFWIETVVS